MELLYIWVEKYGYFKNREFVFNQKYNISFLNNKLIIKKKGDKVSLYNSPIVNINVVAGKNGSGKSCLMELIQDIGKIHVEDTNRLSYFSNIKSNIVFVFQSNDIIEIYSNILSKIIVDIENGLEKKEYNLDTINFQSDGSIFEGRLSNKYGVVRFNNMINFNSGFNEVSKTPVEKFDPIEYELNQTDYKATFKYIHEMLQSTFLFKNIFDSIRDDMSIKSSTSVFPYLYIDKFVLQGIYPMYDSLIDDILNGNDKPRIKLVKAFLGLSISYAKEEKIRRGENLITTIDSLGKKTNEDDAEQKMSAYIQCILDYTDIGSFNDIVFNDIYDKAAQYEIKELRSKNLLNIRNDIIELIKLTSKLKLVEEENCFKIIPQNKEDSDFLTDFILKYRIELNTIQKSDIEITTKYISDFIEYISEYSKVNEDSIVTLKIPERLSINFKKEYLEQHKGIELVDINEFDLCISSRTASGNLVGDKIDIDRLIQKYVFDAYGKGIWGRFGYSYNSVSSGEMTSLLIFKKIFDYFSSGDMKVFGRPIIILLDEPNIALHPELERRFIYLLNKYTSKLIMEALRYSKDYRYKQLNENNNIEEIYKSITVQYIITTHSPIMISDVPKSNIIFLKTDMDKDFDNINKLEETLANNIYEIMLNGMFVKKSIGEYAIEFITNLEKEIDKLSDNLKNKSNIKDISEEIENVNNKVNIIGDVFIKKNLQSKLDVIKSQYIPEDTILKSIVDLESLIQGCGKSKGKVLAELDRAIKRMREEQYD